MAISPALESSPFGRLSAELRLIIWEYALYREDGIQLNHIETPNECSTANIEPNQHASSTASKFDGLELTVYTIDDTYNTEKQPPLLSLTQTCKQIRYEAMPVFLESNAFHALCPIFDNSKGHGEVVQDAIQYSRRRIQTWLRILQNDEENWPAQIKDLTIDLGLWRICGCKSSSQCFVDALTGLSSDFPVRRGRSLKVKFAVQWRAICPCCEGETNDESVWPLTFVLERGNNDAFFEAVLQSCEGRAKWILAREGLCGRTRMAWLVQLERASGRLVEVFGGLGRSGKFWEGGELSKDEV